MQSRIQAAELNLARSIDWIGRYDSKSSFIFGIDTGMLGSLAVVGQGISSHPIGWLPAILAVALLGAGFFMVFAGAYPQLKESADSLLYFGSIAKKRLDEFRAAFSNQTESEYLMDLLSQCHRNSEIVARKFWCLKWASRFVFLAIVPWALTLYLS